ncbi:hypothetical protein PHYSODRAFT_455008, partial [Phytophthora sojae]
AAVSSVSTCSSSLQKNVMFLGANIGKRASIDPIGCCAICARTNGCTAFTWNDSSHGTCFLKTSKGKSFPNSGSISGVV